MVSQDMRAVPEAPGQAPTAVEELLARRRRRRATEVRKPRRFSALRRAEELCDPGTFRELFPLRKSNGSAYDHRGNDVDGDGVVVGWGSVDQRLVAVASHDFSNAGGSIGSAFAEGVVRLQDLAIKRGAPIVYLTDSGGARIHEGVQALHGCGRIFERNVRARHRVPQISVILGPCAGAAAYSPALTDWTIMVRGQSQMFLTGPEVVKAAIGETVEPDALGGATLHASTSGVAHLAVDDEPAAIAAVRRLLSYLPSSRGDDLPFASSRPPRQEAGEGLDTLVPTNPAKPFDMRRLLDGITDDSSRFEVMVEYATSVITTFARLDGVPVGVVASQPNSRGGILDSGSAEKVAKFVSFCGRFGLPVVTLVDVPGFMPGTVEESRGVITRGAQMLAAYADADTPKLTVIVRKAYGGAYIAMGSRSLGADLTWAWADSELAVMGPSAAVGLLHRARLRDAPDPAALRKKLADEYRSTLTHPFIAAESGIIDDVILPEETRSRLVEAMGNFYPRRA